MKNIVIGFMSLIFMLMVILIGYTVYGRSARETELENALNSSMEKALESIDQIRGIKPVTNDELVAVFMEMFLEQLDSKSDVDVEILDVNADVGLLAVKATLSYNHLNNRLGTVSVTKTVIDETYQTAPATSCVEFAWTKELSDGSAYDLGVTQTVEQDTFLSPKTIDGEGSWMLYEVNEGEESVLLVTTGSGEEKTLSVGTSYAPDLLSNCYISDAKAYYQVAFRWVSGEET